MGPGARFLRELMQGVGCFDDGREVIIAGRNL
jgi:hypothetical protein